MSTISLKNSSTLFNDEVGTAYVAFILKEFSTAEAKFIFNNRSYALFKRTALHAMCIRGYKSTVIALLESKLVDINAIDCQDATPLHLACYYQQFEIAEILIAYGAVIYKNLETFLSPLVEELSLMGEQLYDEILDKSEAETFEGIERYTLSQKYIACRNSYGQLAGRIAAQTIDKPNSSTLYYSTISPKRTIGMGKPMTNTRDFEIVMFLEIW